MKNVNLLVSRLRRLVQMMNLMQQQMVDQQHYEHRLKQAVVDRRAAEAALKVLVVHLVEAVCAIKLFIHHHQGLSYKQNHAHQLELFRSRRARMARTILMKLKRFINYMC